MNTDSRSFPYLPALTSLRAIAAFMVFLHHKNFIPLFGNQLAQIFVFQGYTGVSLFFVLSGFLIHRNYIHQLKRIDLSFLKNYFINRFARVYPMYFFILLATLLTMKGFSTYFAFLQFSLLKGLSSSYKFSAVATSWSLTVEECFYLAFPFLALARHRKTPYILLLIILYIIGYALLMLGERINFEGFLMPFDFMSIYTFFGRAFEFLLGMLASELILNNKIKIGTKSFFTYGGVFAVIISLLCMSLIAQQHSSNESEFQLVSMFYTDGLLIHHFVLPIAFTLLIIGLSVEKSFLQKIMSFGFFQLLGKSSYVFYLLQGGIFYYYFEIIFPQSENFMVFLGMCAVSIVAFLFIENHLIVSSEEKTTSFTNLRKLFLLNKLLRI